MTDPVLLTVSEFAARVKYDERTVREALIGKGKLKQNRHWFRLGPRALRIDFRAVCSDMGLPHADFNDDDMVTPEDIAEELKIDVRTLRERWFKGPILKPGVHFARLPVPDCRHIICIRPAILQAFGVSPHDLTATAPPGSPPDLPHAASAVLLREQESLQLSQIVHRPPTTITATDFFEVAAERWRDEETALLTPRTRMQALCYLDQDLMPWFRGYAVSEITRPYILDALGEIEKPKGRAYAHACFHVLKQIFDVAERLWASPSPLRSLVDLPRVNNKLPRVFSLHECQRLINATPPEFHAYIVTRLFTGLTNEEVHSLRWHNVSLDAKVLHVREEYLGGEWVPVDPKVRRSIPLSNLVVSALIAHRSLAVASDGMNLVFHQPNLQPLSTATLTRTLWDPLLSHVGIKPMQLREVRNTAAYLWLVAGESPEDVADWFGYGTDVNRLLNRYGPLASPVQDMTPLDRLFSAQDPSSRPKSS